MAKDADEGFLRKLRRIIVDNRGSLQGAATKLDDLPLWMRTDYESRGQSITYLDVLDVRGSAIISITKPGGLMVGRLRGDASAGVRIVSSSNLWVFEMPILQNLTLTIANGTFFMSNITSSWLDFTAKTATKVPTKSSGDTFPVWKPSYGSDSFANSQIIIGEGGLLQLGCAGQSLAKSSSSFQAAHWYIFYVHSLPAAVMKQK